MLLRSVSLDAVVLLQAHTRRHLSQLEAQMMKEEERTRLKLALAERQRLETLSAVTVQAHARKMVDLVQKTGRCAQSGRNSTRLQEFSKHMCVASGVAWRAGVRLSRPLPLPRWRDNAQGGPLRVRGLIAQKKMASM